jgi:hypothetical protein
MSKKSKKFETEDVAPTLSAEELAGSAVEASTEPKPPRAPRISRPRYTLISASGTELKFTHYALPTRRAPAGKIIIEGVESDFIVTKSQSRDKTEDRSYSYFTLPNGDTGYVSVELGANEVFSLTEKAPAEPFGREPKPATEGAAVLPRAEMPVEA